MRVVIWLAKTEIRHQESYVPTTIKAAQLAQLKRKGDTILLVLLVSGKKVEVETQAVIYIYSKLTR